MGTAYAHDIEAAAKFLIKEMSDVETLDFSHFYSEDETKRDELDRETGIGETALCYLDWAIAQLEQNGVLQTLQLSTILPDGENDYLIAWSKNGRQLVQSGKGWSFRDLNL